ncbi:hypothetical protein Tco_1238433 [Tanacetum coccineum]
MCKTHSFLQGIKSLSELLRSINQEFWASAYVHNRSVRFKMNNKKHIIGLEQFRDILQICPRVGNKKFVEPPLEKEILIFLASLGYSGDIRKITDVNVNKLHQPWRSFAAVINKCLSGTPSYDSLRLSQAQILWGMKLLSLRAIFASALTNEWTSATLKSYNKDIMLGLQEQFLLRQKEARRKLLQDIITQQKTPNATKEKYLEKKTKTYRAVEIISKADFGQG